MYGMTRGGKRTQPRRGGCTVQSDEEWEFRGKRWDSVNSARNRAVGPCRTEDRTHEQHNEMVCCVHTTRDKWKT